ncbi:hypothetical protein Scep_027178 [Stephania cephalantha]|uniref:Late embryogenesis abundant protein LEA-2 subgroup domain-containing protein n=1 Tax=Stephania cephalantha TaxID=152367 RepID=A0AAP0EVF4_9MAGN
MLERTQVEAVREQNNKQKPMYSPSSHTNPLIWLGAIICTMIALAVIITGLVIFVGYMILRPRIPSVSVVYAHEDNLNFDQVGQMDVQISMVIRAENDNEKVHAHFSDGSFTLYFGGLQIAELRMGSLDVPRNSSYDIPYAIRSDSIPLDSEAMNDVDISIKRDKISFLLKGAVRTRWRVGVLRSIKFWSQLSCQLVFFPSNGTSRHSSCSSSSR